MQTRKESPDKMVERGLPRKDEEIVDADNSSVEKTVSENDDSTVHYRIQSFPAMLMKILERQEYEDIITWLPDGKALKILKPRKFTSVILPKHFTEAKYSSFKRKMHRWGFEHSRGQHEGEPTRFGSEETFQHEKFQRDRWDLLKTISCQKHVRVRHRARSISNASSSDNKEEIKADRTRSSSIAESKKVKEPSPKVSPKPTKGLDPVLSTSASFQEPVRAPKYMVPGQIYDPMAHSPSPHTNGRIPHHPCNSNHFHRGSSTAMGGMARFPPSQQMPIGMPGIPPPVPEPAGVMDRLPPGGVYGSAMSMDMLIGRRQMQERAYMAASSREQTRGKMYYDRGDGTALPTPPLPPPPPGGSYPPFY